MVRITIYFDASMSRIYYGTGVYYTSINANYGIVMYDSIKMSFSRCMLLGVF